MSVLALDHIWSALPIPGVLVDSNNRITDLNPAAEMFLNAPKKSASGRHLADCLTMDVDIAASLTRARQGRSAFFHRDVKVKANDRPAVLCDAQIAPLGDENDTMMLLVQPRQIAGRLGRALKVQSTAQTAIGLADMLAHEIKNPLAGITGAAQLLAMGLGKEDQEMTGLILQETRRIVDLLGQVEQFGDVRGPVVSPQNIHDILERARLSAALGVASGMQFRDQYDPSLPDIPGDSDQLVQVFTNLFANAAEAATKKSGTISIRTYFEAGLRIQSAQGAGQALPIQVEITDDGPGISAHMLEHVFDPFVSGRENGTGLGLALVSKIITEHGGAITVKSSPGNTTFRISLPVAKPIKGLS